jgi:tRNA (guanine-N7-)-methyltransferase
MTAKATMDHPRRSQPGAVFGRRQGHKLSPRQGNLIDALLPRLALDLAAPPDLPGLFAPPAEAFRLEIGFGGGEHLVAEAERHPRIGFIGVEPFVNGMAKALSAIEAASSAMSGCISATPSTCWPGCRTPRWRA